MDIVLLMQEKRLLNPYIHHMAIRLCSVYILYAFFQQLNTFEPLTDRGSLMCAAYTTIIIK